MSEVLVLYYSKNGATRALAREVCHGVDSVAGIASRLRTVPAVSTVAAASESDIPESGPPYATPRDLAECAGLVMGSPTDDDVREKGVIGRPPENALELIGRE